MPLFIDDRGDAAPADKNARLGDALLVTYNDLDVDHIQRVESAPAGWLIYLKSEVAKAQADGSAADTEA
jgi:hypothetical protein